MRTLFVFGVISFLAAAHAEAQVNRCAECHFANFASVPAGQQLLDWDRSAHARHNVGCDRCHGGDPTTYQPIDAHRGVMGGHHPLSSVSQSNLALTCAPCHSGVVSSFRMSTHAARLASGQGDAPGCTTCHGAMAAQVPSAARVEATCGECHRPGSPRAGYPASARQRIEALRGIEQALANVETAVTAIENRARRNQLSAEVLLARVAVRSAAEAVHTFDFGVMDERRAIAQRRTSDVVAHLIGR